jgi:hypothetical protein
MILQGLIYASAPPRGGRASSLSAEAHDTSEGGFFRGHLLIRDALLDRRRPLTGIRPVLKGPDTIKKITTRTRTDHALGSVSPFLCPRRHTFPKTSYFTAIYRFPRTAIRMRRCFI